MRSMLRGKKLRLLSVSLILSATSGCVPGLIVRPEPTPALPNSYCKLAAPIGYDGALDTPETVAQIEQHNSKWVCVCEGDCPKQQQ